MARKTVKKPPRSRTQRNNRTSAATQSKTARKQPKQPTTVEENLTVYGLYPDLDQTTSGVTALEKAGFPKARISTASFASVQVPRARGTHDIRCETGADVEESVGVMARMTGCVLGLGSVPFLAPMLLAAPVLGAVGLGVAKVFNAPDRTAMPTRDARPEVDESILLTVNCRSLHAAKRARKALESAGAQSLAISDLQMLADQDLKSREYRDEQGKVHHHTHTYMRDHAEQHTDTAA